MNRPLPLVALVLLCNFMFCVHATKLLESASLKEVKKDEDICRFWTYKPLGVLHGKICYHARKRAIERGKNDAEIDDLYELYVILLKNRYIGTGIYEEDGKIDFNF